MQITTIGII